MSLRRVTTTSLATLRPLGRAADRDYQKIVTYLGSHPSLGSEYARLFSEPVRVRGGDEIDWYWGDSASPPSVPQPLSALSEDTRQRVLGRVRQLLAVVRGEGELLRRKGEGMAAPLLLAASLPEPLDEYIWWMSKPGSAEEGFPVLVGWGFTLDAPHTSKGALEGVRQLQKPSPLHAVSGGSDVGVVDAPVARSASPGVLVGLLWLLFSLLTVAVGVLLLQGCGIHGGAWGFSTGFGYSFCAKPVEEAAPAPDRAGALSSLVQELELSLARKEAACIAQLPPPPPPAPPPPPVAQVQPPTTPAQPALPRAADDRLKLPQTPGRDLSFLRGCWQSDPFKHSPDKPSPGVSTYCFDASGRGTLVFRRGANHECRLPARARLEGGKLFLDDHDGKCNDGTEWFADHLVCEPDRGGIAVCSGTSVRAQWSVNLHKR